MPSKLSLVRPACKIRLPAFPLWLLGSLSHSICLQVRPPFYFFILLIFSLARFRFFGSLCGAQSSLRSSSLSCPLVFQSALLSRPLLFSPVSQLVVSFLGFLVSPHFISGRFFCLSAFSFSQQVPAGFFLAFVALPASLFRNFMSR